MRTGCDGIIGSKLQHDKCGICGGDSTGCIRVVGNFTKKRYESDCIKLGKEREDFYHEAQSVINSLARSVSSTVRATLTW